MSSLYLLKVQKPGVAKKARSAALLNGDDSVGSGRGEAPSGCECEQTRTQCSLAWCYEV